MKLNAIDPLPACLGIPAAGDANVRPQRAPWAQTILAGLIGAVLLAGVGDLRAQGTAFTYQGRLNEGGNPANGSYDLQCVLYTAAIGGNQTGAILTNAAVFVTNGLFTTTLDFGGGVFSGTDYWLEISVRTNGNGVFDTLSPRQAVTPAPYSIFATTASNLSGTLPAAQLSGAVNSANVSGTYGNALTFSNPNNNFSGVFSGNGAGVTNVNAATLGGLSAAGFWKTAGNAGTSPTNGNFLGTTDSQPFDFRVNNSRALRLDASGTQGIPNLLGGWFNNNIAAGVNGAFIGGGGEILATNRVTDDFGVVAGGAGNQAGDGAGSSNDHTYAVVSGGYQNTAAASESVIGGGTGNSNNPSATWSTIGGGRGNIVLYPDGVIAGGALNTMNATDGAIGGGINNTVNAGQGAIAGGSGNVVNTTGSFIGAGVNNSASGSYYDVIGGGWNNTNAAPTGVIGGGYFNWLDATGTSGFIGGGFQNYVNGSAAVIAGGQLNTNIASLGAVLGGYQNNVSGGYSMVGGGSGNVAGGSYSSLGGGLQNNVFGFYSSVAGGRGNTNNGYYAAIPGGYQNLAQGDYSLAAGKQAQALTHNTFIWNDGSAGIFGSTASNQFLIHAAGGVGINLTNPAATLDVNGTVHATSFLGIVNAAALSGTLTNTLTFATSNGVPFQVAATNAGVVTNLNADLLGGFHAASFWNLGGNSGTTASQFLGTVDNKPLMFRVNNQEAMRFEPTTDTPNVVGGYAGNLVQSGLSGVTIAGGGTALSSQPNAVTNNGNFGTIAGGYRNTVTNYGGAILGGSVNFNGGSFGAIGAGQFNTELGNYSWIGGGNNNSIQAGSGYSVVGGGNGNVLQANTSDAVIAGGYGNAVQSGANYSVIGGGNANAAAGAASAIAGGEANKTFANADHSFVGGGQANEIFTAPNAVIVGGSNNAAQALGAAVGGGWNNQAGTFVGGTGIASVVAGGSGNSVVGNYSLVAGGINNAASGSYSAILGGDGNGVSGNYAVAAGGLANNAGADYSFAAGRRAQAQNQGAFVWADSQNADFVSGVNDAFLIRATNGVGINTANPRADLNITTFHNGLVDNTPALLIDEEATSAGAENVSGSVIFASHGVTAASIYVAQQAYGMGEGWSMGIGPYSTNGHFNYAVELGIGNAGVQIVDSLDVGADISAHTVYMTSDRNAKTNFAAVDAKDILEKVAALPITSWNFTAGQPHPHIGPMAQDFYAAFGLGKDEKHIATVDEEGVALAAIQGLNQKLGEKDAEIAALKKRLDKLEALLEKRDSGQ